MGVACSSSLGYSGGVHLQWLCQAMAKIHSTGVMQNDGILLLLTHPRPALVPSPLLNLPCALLKTTIVAVYQEL